MGRLEFYVQKVVDYTSRYNYTSSCYYAPTNLIGKYEQYPAYGDFPEAYCLRFYGNWWKQTGSYQPNYRPQDFDKLGAEDYVTVEFEGAVIPEDICVYEVYNPGAVVRIWGNIRCSSKRPWILLWEGKPENFPHKSRKFHPKIRLVPHLIKTIRLEFNQSHLEYHYSVEAILMGGFQPISELENEIISKKLLGKIQIKRGVIEEEEDNKNKMYLDDYFLQLPNEVILHIFQYLDLKSLSQCSQVNKRWNLVSADALLYQNINLKPYWYLVNCDTIRYFVKKCKTLKKLDLSWCGNDFDGFSDIVTMFIEANAKSLTHLSLGNCKFVDDDIMSIISNCRELVDLRLRNLHHSYSLPYSSLGKLKKLECLDLTSSNIGDYELISILKSNPNLKVIIIDLCEHLQMLDQIVATVVEYNKNISTWSCWKTYSLTSKGVRLLSKCHNLTELDLGWCFLNKDPMDCLSYIAKGCPKLKRLVLSEWRGLNDILITPVIMSCRELTQLDFLGIKNISYKTYEKALMFLPKLRLLDLCYGDSIIQEKVNVWRQQYPHVTIQV